MEIKALTDKEFQNFRSLIYDLAGINLSNEKKALVSGRLLKRLRHYQFSTYSDYYDLVTSGNEAEKQIMINLISTNETYFFREMDHFDFLKDLLTTKFVNSGKKFRLWSAASSSGEEVYSSAFIISDTLNNDNWEIIGSDINEDMLQIGSSGLYSMERAKNIPKQFLKKYCLKGVRSQEGKFVIRPEIKKNIRFMKLNLLQSNSSIGKFDFIFLRNVMIYFNLETRKKVVGFMMEMLNEGGLLVVGHAESLIGVTDKLKALRPTIYHIVP